MTLIQDAGDIVLGQFTEKGLYEVGLTAFLGECVDHVAKKITVIGTSEEEEGGRLGHQEYVKSFTLHPNPSDGSFHVTLELLEPGPVTFSIWNATTNRFIHKRFVSGKDEYSLYFDLRPLSSGSYVLRMDHHHGKKYIRFIVE